MEFDTKKEMEGTVVSIKGRMDALTAPDIENRLTAILDQGEKKLVMDLAGLSYISSAGLRSLLATAKKLKRDQGQMAFANLGGHVAEVFKISGFHSLFTICNSVSEALGSLGDLK